VLDLLAVELLVYCLQGRESENMLKIIHGKK
jgi:hypothetical protein